jgi:hypothetical protein
MAVVGAVKSDVLEAQDRFSSAAVSSTLVK